MQYVALLRGINVGGNTIVKMSDLKIIYEKVGCRNVSTYINSGNVMFEHDKSVKELVSILEKALENTFHYRIRIVVISIEQLKKIIDHVPEEWGNGSELRKYVAFVKEPVAAEDVAKAVDIKKNVDSLKIGRGVLYMSTKLDGLTKSSFTKLASKKIYQDITIRNYTTVEKLLFLMKKK
jgi:uncharacterized protein (DUF1697 family)